METPAVRLPNQTTPPAPNVGGPKAFLIVAFVLIAPAIRVVQMVGEALVYRRWRKAARRLRQHDA